MQMGAAAAAHLSVSKLTYIFNHPHTVSVTHACKLRHADILTLAHVQDYPKIFNRDLGV